MALDQRELAIRQKLKDDFVHYSQRCLKIRTKPGAIIPFIMNAAQLYIHQKIEEQRKLKGLVRAIVLKGRQQGCSTYVQGRFYWRITHNKGLRAFILTHEQKATDNLFDMTERYHRLAPDIVKPLLKKSNKKELVFGKLDSSYAVGTAGTKGVGVSNTIQLFHGSEVALWPNADEHAAGIMQTIGYEEGTEVILESTARGIGNYFHSQWQLAELGKSDLMPIFVPWFWQPEYRREVPDDFELMDEEKMFMAEYKLDLQQLVWRRYKISDLSVGGAVGEAKFKREYPFNPEEAFENSGEGRFITPSLAMDAMRRDLALQMGAPRLMGVDVARFGDDRTVVIRRCGRKAFEPVFWRGADTMRTAAKVAKMINEYKPDAVFVDGVGVGAGVVDRLQQMGFHQVIEVQSGNKPDEENREVYANKRAEMWGRGKEWLENADLPDNQELLADLVSPTYHFDAKHRILIEKKEKLKERGMQSPDFADALFLTFAYPVHASFREQSIEPEALADY